MKPGDLVILVESHARGRVIEVLPGGNIVVRWSHGTVASVPAELLRLAPDG